MLDTIASWENIFLFFAVALSYFVKAIAGFGNTLVMGPLFSFVVPNALTTPIDLLMSIPTNGYMAWRERKDINLKAAVPLAVLMIAGLIPGTFFLKTGADWVLKSVLGLVIVATAIQIAFERPDSRSQKRNPAALAFIGLASGVLAGIFGMGVLAVVYFRNTTENKRQFRSNTCSVFFVENVFRLILYWITGILNRQVFFVTAALFPALVIGMIIGRKTDKYIDEAKMRYTVVVLLASSGAALLVKNLFLR